MSSQLDKSLDEITAERRQTLPNRPRRGGPQRQDIRRSAGGVQKRRTDSYSSAPRGASSNDDNWTHDLFDRNSDKASRLASNPLAARLGETTSRPARLKVENLHYDLSEDDLSTLFSGIGPVESLRLKYDRLGRSDGVAYVTYTSSSDANEAIRKFDGANAAGQPITVTLDAEAPSRRPGPIAAGGPRLRGPRGPVRSGPRDGGRSGPRGGAGGGRERRPARSQDDLDKELDDFMNGPPPAENGNGNGPVSAEEEMALD